MEERFDYRSPGNLFFFICILLVGLLLAVVGIYVAYSFRERGTAFIISVIIAGLALESIFIREGSKRLSRYLYESFTVDNDKLTFNYKNGKRDLLWEDIIRLVYFNPTGTTQEFQIQSRRAGRTIIFDSSLIDFERLITNIEKKTGRKFEEKPRPVA
ncbi:MAG: hypothetical protein J7M18_03780 [Candidatus Eremiobacteraeota bacterium]|nr:hypothetical protein [Candidatus Eremiobacteraeota bacterium]